MATLLSVRIILRVGSRPAQLFFHATRERMTAQNPPATSGASHSFVAANIIRELGLKTRFVDALEVLLTDNSVVCSHKVVDFPVCFACNATQDIACRIIPSLHSAIILGMDWLRKWNPCVDWLH